AMKKIEETFIVPCTVDTFWSTFLDEQFMKKLFTDVLAFKAYNILELTPTSRKVHTVPKMNLPAVIEKLVGDTFAYEEHGTLDRAANVWRWQMVNDKKKKEMVATSGSIRVEPLADGKCRRINAASVEGKVFGLGGIIESSAEKEIRAAWAKEAVFLNEWLQKQKA
ncbi:MAG TPA: DUF2505 domain-containing protein, partial [Polyangia bacterium]|nr:DUF2505 domain-containing protein [Polyangia bacterium]